MLSPEAKKQGCRDDQGAATFQDSEKDKVSLKMP